MIKNFTRIFLTCLVLFGLSKSMGAQLAVDAAKPYVYIEFDHKSASQSTNGHVALLWLRFVNNSTLPLRVKTYSKGKGSEEVGINYSMQLTSEGRLKYLKDKDDVPVGHMQDVSSSEIIPSGSSLVFTIPATDVSEYWYIDTSCRFDLPRKMRGNDPTLHLTFSHEQLP